MFDKILLRCSVESRKVTTFNQIEGLHGTFLNCSQGTGSRDETIGILRFFLCECVVQCKVGTEL